MQSQSRFLRETENIFLAEVVQLYDRRCSHFSESIEKEFGGLRKKKAWYIVSRNSLPTSINILENRFLLTIKDEWTAK